MKKRVSFVCVYLCLLTLLCLGAAELLAPDKGERLSASENRMLAAFPSLSWQSVADGSFMSGFENYLSDAFPFRDGAASFHDGVMALVSVPDDGPATGVVEDERLWEQSEEQEEAFRQLVEERAEQGGEESPSAAPESTPSPEASGERRDVTLWLEGSDGKRSVIFTYPADDVADFASILNRYRARLPEDGRLYFVSPQVAEIANNIIGKSRYVGWGTDLVEVMQPQVDDGVIIVDDLAILAPYLNDAPSALYPTKDYHWHAISASLTADAMMREQGVAPADYDQYRYWISDRGDRIARSTEELAGMHYSRESVLIMSPLSPAESFFLNDLTQRRSTIFTSPDGGYIGFLGGHHGPWRLVEGGFHTGRRALVVGDCFTIPLIPYLAPYYDQIISTDVRDNFYSVDLAGANIGDYIAQYDVDDIYVVWSTNARFYSENIRSRMSAYLDMVY